MAQSKYIRRMREKLAKRVARYEEAVKHRKDGGKGIRKPGSQNVRKGGG